MSTVKKFSEADLKNRPDALIESAQDEPILIQKSGSKPFVMMSAEEYEHLRESIIDAYWLGRAEEALARFKPASDEQMLEYFKEAKARGVDVPEELIAKYKSA